MHVWLSTSFTNWTDYLFPIENLSGIGQAGIGWFSGVGQANRLSFDIFASITVP